MITTDKILLITGGTGSFGSEVLSKYITSDLKQIRILSRDEKKQDDLRHLIQKKYPTYADKVKFYIGDVRDSKTTYNVTKDVNYIFHAAALKQVPSCEFYPIEAVKTNVLGTDNVLTSAIENNVERVICLSTDKACYPINAMGMTKALLEKTAIAKSKDSDNTTICCTRYGNVMCSRGSVIPLWIQAIKNKEQLTITNPDMTRFMMSLPEAVNLVEFAFDNGNSGDLFVQKAPSCTLRTLSNALCEIFSYDKSNIKIIGDRHGEKLYETLLTDEECFRASEFDNFYCVHNDSRGLNYDNNMCIKETSIKSFNSNNTTILNEQQMIDKLLTIKYVQDELK